MKKVFKELLVLVCVLIVAAVITIPIALNVTQRSDADTLSGIVEKIPVNISSPVYGIILSIPVDEGATVAEGQTLATIQILDPHFSLPNASQHYVRQGDILTIESPVSGVMGQISLAPQSTIGGNEKFIQMYAVSNADIQILLPQGKDINSYSAFSIVDVSNGAHYPLQVLDQIPADIVSNVPQSTTVYRAKCVRITDCQKIVDDTSVTISALKKQQKGHVFNIPFLGQISF